MERVASTFLFVLARIISFRGRSRCRSTFPKLTMPFHGFSRKSSRPERCGGDEMACATFEVTDLSHILERVIPFFERFPIRSGKSRDFETFCRIAELMSQGAHRTREGIAVIVRLRSPMNRGGKRRYPDHMILETLRLEESSEAIRQAPMTCMG